MGRQEGGQTACAFNLPVAGRGGCSSGGCSGGGCLVEPWLVKDGGRSGRDEGDVGRRHCRVRKAMRIGPRWRRLVWRHGATHGACSGRGRIRRLDHLHAIVHGIAKFHAVTQICGSKRECRCVNCSGSPSICLTSALIAVTGAQPKEIPYAA